MVINLSTHYPDFFILKNAVKGIFGFLRLEAFKGGGQNREAGRLGPS